MEMSQNVCAVSKRNPAAGSETTTMDQSCQMTNPRNSAPIDQRRLRAAIAAPPFSPLDGVSASIQPSIPARPWRRPGALPQRAR